MSDKVRKSQERKVKLQKRQKSSGERMTVSHNGRMKSVEEQSQIPWFDELLPRFKGHPMATVGFIDKLKAAAVIVAICSAREQMLLLYGADIFEHAREHGEEVPVFPVEVSSFKELQFVLSAIQKFVGQPNTDGEPWWDL